MILNLETMGATIQKQLENPTPIKRKIIKANMKRDDKLKNQPKPLKKRLSIRLDDYTQ